MKDIYKSKLQIGSTCNDSHFNVYLQFKYTTGLYGNVNREGIWIKSRGPKKVLFFFPSKTVGDYQTRFNDVKISIL